MKLVGFLLAAVGGLILLLCAWYVVEATGFLLDSDPTTGVVVEHEFTGGLNTGRQEVGPQGGSTVVTDLYAPIVEFDGPTGHKIRFKANWSEGSPPPIGSEVGVRYRTDNPGEARITGLSALYGAAGILLLLGVTLGGAGVLIWRKPTRSFR